LNIKNKCLVQYFGIENRWIC